VRIASYRDPGFPEVAAALRRSALPKEEISRTVADFIGQVRAHGDAALVELTNKFSSEKITAEQLRVTRRARKPSVTVERALRYSLKNIALFSQRRVPKAWKVKNQEGAEVGEVFHPLKRVGCYVPGGTAPLISTALMTVSLAKVAGVPEIVVCTPPPVNDTLLYALQLAGATEIYQAGGAQGIAALAYGTETIKPVDKIFGPGNAYVVEAKRQVFGQAGIDLLPGPSEIAVIADATADAACVAADLLAQAEHGHGSEIYLLTPDTKLVAKIQAEIERQLKTLARQEFLQETLEQGAFFIVTKDLKQAVALVEDIAPEHLSLMGDKAEKLAGGVRNCGAVFIGRYSPVAAGDYLAGPSHTLPTGGAGRAFAGLTVDQFMRRTSVVRYKKKSLRRAAPSITELAEAEEMGAHARSVTIRFEMTEKAKPGKRK
jgi:histidinol dehydrogenase